MGPGAGGVALSVWPVRASVPTPASFRASEASRGVALVPAEGPLYRVLAAACVAALLTLGAAGCHAGTSAADAEAVARIPARLADSAFWRLMRDFSESGSTFRSENLVSNETSLQYVLPALVARVPAGGVYVGVAPDQNFTYVAALRPAIAFVVDIRHQNAMELLMYKALIEASRDRAEFLAMLFGRAPLAGVDTTSSAEQLFEALDRQPPDSARYRANVAAILDRLTRVHRFALSDSERTLVACVYGAFFAQGPSLTYGYSTDCRDDGGSHGYGRFGVGGRGRPGMPTYFGMLAETDGAGRNWSYLGSERAFRAVKAMEERNLIVPLTGDFAGPKALRSIGEWTRAHDATIRIFYVSNVEQYLWEDGDAAKRFYTTLSAWPLDSSSTFIQSFGAFRISPDPELLSRPHSPRDRSYNVVNPMQPVLEAFRAGKLTSWEDVLRMSK